MSKVAIQGNASGTGTFTIAAPNSNTDRTLTLPDEAGTVLTSASDVLTSASSITPNASPVFRATMSADQNLSSGTWTKVQFDTEVTDTNNFYDHTTNYRFTPTVAGFYWIAQKIHIRCVGGSITRFIIESSYNGSAGLFRLVDSRTPDGDEYQFASGYLHHFNGSTDYVESRVYCESNVTPAVRTTEGTYFAGYLVRAD